MTKEERHLTAAEIQALNIPVVMWRNFKDEEPDKGKMVIVREQGCYWTSQVKMLENHAHEVTKMCNMVQHDNTPFWCGVNWFDECQWTYAT